MLPRLPWLSRTLDPLARLGAKGKAAADRHGDLLPAGALARLGTTRLRHQADVTFVSFGANGKTILTAGQDGTVRLWDLATGKEIRRFPRPKPGFPKLPEKKDKPGAVEMMALLGGGQNGAGDFPVALAPDGKTLAAGSGNVIQFHEVATGKELHRIQGPPSGLAGLLFSPDSRTLAGRARNGAVYLWSAEAGKELRQFKVPPRKAGNAFILTVGGGDTIPLGMAFTHDNKVLAAAMIEADQESNQSAIKLWEVASGKEIRQIKAPKGVRVSAMAFSPDEKTLAFGAGDVVYLCQADTGKEVRQLKMADGGLRTLVFSPDGKTLAGRGKNQLIRLWETATGKELHQLAEPEPAPRRNLGGGLIFVSGIAGAGPESRALAFSPDGSQIAAAAGCTIRLWETATGREVVVLDGHRQAPSAITISRDGKAVVSWGADRVIRRWQANGRFLGGFPAPRGTTLAAFSQDGRIVALANVDKTIRLHETASGKELQRFKDQGGAAALAFAPNVKTLASRGSDNIIRHYDVKRGAELGQFTLRSGNNQPPAGVLIIGGSGRGKRGPGPGLAFSPDGKLLVSPGAGPSSDTLVIFDVTTGKELRTIESPQAVSSFAFSPDGRSLATQNADWTISLWEVASGKKRGHLGKPVAARPKPDAGMMGLTFVIDGLPSAGFSEPSGPVRLTFSPDGRVLAARGSDLSVRVWDVTAGREIGKFKGHRGPIETLAFAPDGKTLASSATDTTILLWDATGPLKNLSQPKRIELAPVALKGLWDDLAGADAAKALQSVLMLTGDPGRAVSFLGERLKPVTPIDPQKMNLWIAELSSEKFLVRKEATAKLQKAGQQAVPALQKVLPSRLPLETRRRVEGLLERLTSGTLTAEQLRLIRALEALERMGTPEARQLVRSLAQGAPGELLTLQAQAVLDRLAVRPAGNKDK